jgi:predicted ATP-grasp superfamily ATP-dependent carboligase
MRVLIATTSTPDDRKTLCAVRSLGAAGADVTLASDRLLGGACYSRFVRRRVVYAPANGARGTDVAVIAEALEAELLRSRYDVLLPMNDYTMLAAAGHAEILARHAALAVPEPESLRLARDKLETLRLAARLGIDTPETHCVRNADELRAVAGHLAYPCVMKPRRGAGAVGLEIATSPEGLFAACMARDVSRSDAVYDFGDVLVQAHAPGEIHDVCLLMRHGEPRAVLSQRRLLTYPRRGGVGIYVETTHEPELIERALVLLRELRWHGPGQVEFKVDPSDGKVRLMEINGRFWGTVDAAVAAGIDFPLLACRLAIDGDVEPAGGYTVGLRYRWPVAFGLLAALESPEPWATLRSLITPARGSRWDLRPSDPLPHLAEMLYVARRMVERRSLLPQRTVAWPLPRAGRARQPQRGS